MVFHYDAFFSIYFGDASDKFFPEYYLSARRDLNEHARLQIIKKRFDIQSISFLHQTHSVNGYLLSESCLLSPFSVDGDFLITRAQRIGIGILTADCLPIICFDRKNQAIGIAHAGWRGAVNGIIKRMLQAMHDAWGSEIKDCYFFFGPSAKRCCYTVSTDFYQHLEAYAWAGKALQKNERGLNFDLPLFASLYLESLGALPDTICFDYNNCTICDFRFYSYRRSIIAQNFPERGRQMTIVSLK